MTIIKIPKILILGSIAFIVVLLTSCNSTKYLTDGQSIIKGTKILFKSNTKINDKKTLEAELLTFIKEKPNEKLLFFIPKEWIYLRNSAPEDTLWYHNGLRVLGQPPSIYHEDNMRKTVKEMENYLRLNKGYYEAKVDFIVEESSDLVGFQNSTGSELWEKSTSKVTFIVAPGERYKIKSVLYKSQDTELLSFLEGTKDAAFVKKGDYIDYTQFELEKSRMTLDLQNNGYTNFSNSFVEILGDSNQVNKNIDIIFEIKTPLPDTFHQKYVTGKINVYTDFIKNHSSEDLVKESIRDISFYRQSSTFLVKPTLLNNSIFFKEGSILRREERLKTFKKLNSLGTYRFVTINSTPDEVQDSVMNFDILLTPFQKKWIFDGSLEGYFSTLGASRLFGVSLAGALQNRNLLGGSEKYTLRAELGTELGFNPGVSGISARTRNISIHNNLNIPSFRDFLGLGKLAWRAGVIRDKFYKSFVEEANTNIGLSFSSINIINFYSLSSYNASFGFDYTSVKGNRYIFRPLGFNLDLYAINDSTRFVDNPLIFLSFKDNLGTGFIFRDFSYIYNSGKSRKGNSFLVINNIEVSGWEVYLTNRLYNAISGSGSDWAISRGNLLNRDISFAKYVRYEFDGRHYKEYSKTKSLASRLNVGIIIPFGANSASPFIRQFGVGGPNSLRAWNVKEAGPGGYRDPNTNIKVPQFIFVNQGDIKIEANIEYRFKILLILDGALFVDAGNVWTLKDDPDRPHAAISPDFLNQMAIGAGYGLRLNFNFFNIRFDFGYKIRSPYRESNLSSQWYSFKEVRQQGLGNIQVAVNYPF